jgi:hypothetical protein
MTTASVMPYRTEGTRGPTPPFATFNRAFLRRFQMTVAEMTNAQRKALKAASTALDDLHHSFDIAVPIFVGIIDKAIKYLAARRRAGSDFPLWLTYVENGTSSLVEILKDYDECTGFLSHDDLAILETFEREMFERITNEPEPDSAPRPTLVIVSSDPPGKQ